MAARDRFGIIGAILLTVGAGALWSQRAMSQANRASLDELEISNLVGQFTSEHFAVRLVLPAIIISTDAQGRSEPDGVLMWDLIKRKTVLEPTFTLGFTYHWMRHWEQKLMRAASPFLDDRHEPPFQECVKLATPYMEFYCGGEGKLSIGRAIKFAQQGAAMVVNCAPFGCMPETVATSVFGRVSADVDMPIVSMFYDGNGGQNRRLEVFLNNAVSGKRQAGHTQIGGFQSELPGKDRLIPVENLTSRIRTGGNAGESA